MTDLFNLDAEKGILGSVLLESDKVITFAINQKHLAPSSFYASQHSLIWKTLADMHVAKQAIDILTVSARLGKSGGLEKVGGVEYLNTLLDATPTAAHAEYYIDIVCQWSTIRRINDFEIAQKEAINKGDVDECHRLNAQIKEALDDHEEASARVERFPEIRYQDLVDYRVPEGHIIGGKGWLRRGAGCLLTGGTSLGKSILASQIAVSVASGKNILGCINVPTPMRVTYLQAENDEETLQRDILSIVNHIEADTALVQENLAIHHLYGLSGMALDTWIEKQIIKQKTDLLILDPYQDFIPSGMNINDAGTFLAFNFNLNRIIQEHNCAFLLITHTPKPRDREAWTARESVYMAVGSQAIAAWARTSAEITGYKDDDSKYRLRFGKNAERTGLVSDSGGIVRDLMIQHSPSIHEPYWEVSESQEEPATTSDNGKEIIKLALEHPSYSQREIAKLVNCSVGTVSKWYPRS